MSDFADAIVAMLDADGLMSLQHLSALSRSRFWQERNLRLWLCIYPVAPFPDKSESACYIVYCTPQVHLSRSGTADAVVQVLLSAHWALGRHRYLDMSITSIADYINRGLLPA